ncbi:hypothetical protein Tco_1488732, partial [Tanacetum coccineum]
MDSNEGLGGGWFMVLGGKSSRESKNTCGEVGGVEKISSTGSKFMVRGEECLEGYVGAGGVRSTEVEMTLGQLEVIDFGMVEMLDE